MRKEPNIDLRLCDNMELMKEYPDKYFDLAIVDPPYGIGEGNGQDKSRNIKRVDKRNGKEIIIKKPNYESKKWDFKKPGKEYFKELFRVSKNQIVWGGNYFTNSLPPSMGWIVWNKVNGNSDFSDCELAFTSFNKGLRKVDFMWSGMIMASSIKTGIISEGNKQKCEKRIHPTQKPVALYRWLLTNYAKEGDKILDTHLGSGSIAIACHELGFDLVGCELDQDYYRDMMKRFNQHKAQLVLF